MAKRKSLKNEVTDYLKQAGGATIFWGCTTFALSRYTDMQVDWMFPFIVGPVTPILYRVLDGFKMPPQPSISVGISSSMQSQKRGLFASAVHWSSTGAYDSRRGNDGYISRKIRYDEPLRNQLFWDVQLGNRLQPVRVFEDNLHRFVASVSKRQRNGLPPFSRNYFKRQWPEPEYNAMVQVLWSCQLIYNRGQGASGKLTVLTPYAAMWQVKTTYSSLLH